MESGKRVDLPVGRGARSGLVRNCARGGEDGNGEFKSCPPRSRSIHSTPTRSSHPTKDIRVTDTERSGADTYESDALVVGSGAAGMSAAITAAHRGLKVLIAEKEATFGGTTARSGGWLWIPGTSLARGWGIVESTDQARTYLRHEAG